MQVGGGAGWGGWTSGDGWETEMTRFVLLGSARVPHRAATESVAFEDVAIVSARREGPPADAKTVRPGRSGREKVGMGGDGEGKGGGEGESESTAIAKARARASGSRDGERWSSTHQVASQPTKYWDWRSA